MELHQLRYFCAVAHNGNFTRAAKAENVAQPSLSQQILKLEAELGAKLFDRFPRSARLTQFGKTLLFRAEANDAFIAILAYPWRTRSIGR